MLEAVPTWTAGLEALLQDKSLVYLGLFLIALIDATGFSSRGRVVLVASAAIVAD